MKNILVEFNTYAIINHLATGDANEVKVEADNKTDFLAKLRDIYPQFKDLSADNMFLWDKHENIADIYEMKAVDWQAES